MADLGYKVIFTCPTNTLVQNYEVANDKITSVTVNEFSSIQMGDVKLTSFDYSELNDFMLMRFVVMICIYLIELKIVLIMLNIKQV